MDVPLVAADTPIHREIAGDAALFHKVGDSSDLAAKLEEVLCAKGNSLQRVQLGKQRVSQFTWGHHAHSLVDAILEMTHRPNETSCVAQDSWASRRGKLP